MSIRIKPQTLKKLQDWQEQTEQEYNIQFKSMNDFLYWIIKHYFKNNA